MTCYIEVSLYFKTVGLLENSYRKRALDGIDSIHSTLRFNFSPPGGTDTDKQISNAQRVCVCLSLSHLTAMNGT